MEGLRIDDKAILLSQQACALLRTSMFCTYCDCMACFLLQYSTLQCQNASQGRSVVDIGPLIDLHGRESGAVAI